MFTITITLPNNTQEVYTTKSLKKAYNIYENAINNGYYVNSFTTKNGTDLRDKPQAAIIVNS